MPAFTFAGVGSVFQGNTSRLAILNFNGAIFQAGQLHKTHKSTYELSDIKLPTSTIKKSFKINVFSGLALNHPDFKGLKVENLEI